jgi:hypothetical protein
MTTATMPLNMKWSDEGPSIRFDILGLAIALALHTPLFFMKFNAHKKTVDTPRERLVAIDMVGQEIFKKEEAPPPPPVAPAAKENSLMEKLKALVHKEPPPPPKKEEVAKPLDLGPKQIDLKSKMAELPPVTPKIESKSGFKTDMDPKLAEEKKLAMNTGGPALAPLTASKVGTLTPKSTINSKSGFQVSKTESLSSIGGSGPKLADASAPAIAIRTGGRGALTVTDDVSSKVPKIDKILTLFFNDGRGGLSRRNPDQAELPLTPMKNDAPVPLRVATRNGEEA